MSLPNGTSSVDPGTRPLSKRIDPGAVWTVFALALERLVRGRRLLVLALLFCLPIGIADLAQRYSPHYDGAEAERALVFYMLPQALVPLTALILASGLIQDEVEEQTLTYLLVRPIPRWAIYGAKLLAVVVVSVGLTFAFTAATLVAVHWNPGALPRPELLQRAGRIGALLGFAAAIYSVVFGALGLLVRRSLILGVSYIILFEGLFANVPFMIRKGTVMYYIRVLAERWLGLEVAEWAIQLDEAPSARACLLTLGGIAAFAVLLGTVAFHLREYRVKTPEGN